MRLFFFWFLCLIRSTYSGGCTSCVAGSGAEERPERERLLNDTQKYKYKNCALESIKRHKGNRDLEKFELRYI